MPKLSFQWNSVPKLTLGAEVRRLVPKLFRAEVTRAEHRLPLNIDPNIRTTYANDLGLFNSCVFEANRVFYN